MASAFSIKNYFKKIYSPDVLVEFYKRHEITAIFEVTESTPRKNVVGIFVDFYTSLSPEQKIEISKELALISSISTKHSPSLFSSLLKEKKTSEVTQLECISPYDKALYHYMFNSQTFEEVIFFHDFYISRGYMLYEAKEIDLVAADYAMTELSKEFNRIANKEDNATECDFTYKILDGLLYLSMSFDGKQILTPKKDLITGEVDRAALARKKEEVKIVYLPHDKEILISHSGPKSEKLTFLDTFLRIVCKSAYEGKVEYFDLSSFSDETFDFSKTNRGVPLLTWKIKAVTLSFGGSEKAKKKMRLMIPSSQQEYGTAPFHSTLKEIGILSKIKEYSVENVALSFSFTDTEKGDKSVQVSSSLSQTKSSLCPLFRYDRYARTLLKLADIEQGFVEPAKKEKDEVTKKWEV